MDEKVRAFFVECGKKSAAARQALPPEARSKAAKKAWTTRRRNIRLQTKAKAEADQLDMLTAFNNAKEAVRKACIMPGSDVRASLTPRKQEPAPNEAR